MIGYSVSDSIPCATDNVIPNNAFIMYLTDIQKSHNAEYSFAISYDEHTCEATELNRYRLDSPILKQKYES